MTFSQAITPLITELMQAKKLHTGLVCGTLAPQTWPGQWDCLSLDNAAETPFKTRYDLAIIYVDIHEATSTSLRYYTTLLTKLRDLMARHTLVISNDPDSVLMTSLGYNQLLPINSETLDLTTITTNTNKQHTWLFWQFNITAYKQKPDWLNARFWANPENFDKFRW